MIYVEAWHCVGPYFREASFKEEPVPYRLNTTHFRVPVTMTFVPGKLVTPEPEVCETAFHFFNWYSEEHDCKGEAPDKVNEFARKYGTHASMSVGDIVQIMEAPADYNSIWDKPNRVTLWMCMAVGWKQIQSFDERFDSAVWHAKVEDYQTVLHRII